MGLSDQEKKILADLEQQFDDLPDYSHLTDSRQTFVPQDQAGKSGKGFRFSPRILSWMLVIIVLGLVLLCVGMSMGYSWQGIGIGVFGILIMLLGATIPANRKLSSLLDPKKADRQSRQRSSRNTLPAGQPSFKDRQQEKWDRRHS